MKVENKTVLELGSGCGLVGIAAMILGAKEVVMTDLQYALPLMAENAERNEQSIGNGRISCKECDWFNPPKMENILECPDVILVADCVWLSSLVTPLLQTLKIYTMNNSTKVIITYQQRVSH